MKARSSRSAVLLIALASLLASPIEAQSLPPDSSGEPGPSAGPSQGADSSFVVPALSGPEGTWRVSAFDSLGEGLVEPLAGSRLTLSLLPAGRLEGETACGTYLGGYDVDGESIRLGIVGRGPGRCGPRREDEAIGLTQALSLASRWVPGAAGLELHDADGQVRVVLVADGSGSISGEWRVLRHASGRGRLRSTPARPALSVAFEDAGRVSGSTGCRSFAGGYSVEAERIVIAPIDVLGQACDGRPRRLERELLTAFDETVTWQRDGDVLTLLDATGDELIVAEALPTGLDASPAPTSPTPAASLLPAGSALPTPAPG